MPVQQSPAVILLLPPETVTAMRSCSAASLWLASATLEFGMSKTAPTRSSLNHCVSSVEATSTSSMFTIAGQDTDFPSEHLTTEVLHRHFGGRHRARPREGGE